MCRTWQFPDLTRRHLPAEETGHCCAASLDPSKQREVSHSRQHLVKSPVTMLHCPGCMPLQFLPQEKVADFAGMNSKELLVETERAVGDARLAALHTELVEMRKELRMHLSV